MPQGLQIFDANGNMTLDIADRLTRVLGEFVTGAIDGSLVDNNIATGTPWFYQYVIQSGDNWRARNCRIYFVNNTIYWVYQQGSTNQTTVPLNMRVIYGVY